MKFQMRFFVLKTRRKTTIFKIYAFDFHLKLAQLDMFLYASSAIIWGPSKVATNQFPKVVENFLVSGTFPTYG